MPIRFLAVAISCGLPGLAACEHIDEIAEVRSPEMPPSTEEPQRINVDEIGPKVVRHTGVAPVTASLADPRFTLPRAQTTAFEDEPPPAPVVVTAAQKWFAALSAVDRKTVREMCREAVNDPCFGMLPEPRNSQRPPSRMQQLMAQLGERDDKWTVHNYCRERNPGIVCDTPLVVAFDDQPVAFEPSARAFSFQGTPVHTDWPSAATPWIALDRDGDGVIASGAELFGDATVLPDGTKARHGFEALAALDDNRDGVIDRRDPAFAKLVLWTDRDGDRRSSATELRPLSELIDVLPLAHEVSARCTGGNCEGERAAMQWRDDQGRVRAGAVIDVYLRRR